MSEVLWLMVAVVSSWAGMGWLALAMDAHWGQVTHRGADAPTAVRRVLRTLGIAALSLSLLACLLADRPSIAVLVWIMVMAGSALSVALTLARRPRLVGLLWPL